MSKTKNSRNVVSDDEGVRQVMPCMLLRGIPGFI